MSKNEMISLIETMNNYDDLAAKAKAKADAIREAIKEEMVRQNTEELSAGAYIVRYTSIISNRFDSTTFKRLYADLYKDFTKSVSSRRFSVSCSKKLYIGLLERKGNPLLCGFPFLLLYVVLLTTL